MFDCREEVLALTKQLVRIESIVNEGGEKVLSQALHTLISSYPYFQQQVDHVIYQQTENDDQERYNVIAFVKGTKNPSNKTVLLMGHIDTVGIDDFNLKELALDPDALAEALHHEDLTEEVRSHLESGEFEFGRGMLDMKSGVASHLYLLKYYSEHPEELEGNLMVVFECDEEDGSHGIISALSELKRLREVHGFDYVAAINADFVSPRYTGDPNRYIYKGTVGKLLPSFFITGSETHVGSCFEGIDPNFIAAHLTRQISYNPALCNEAFGEITVPPVSLKQMDLKPTYTVQTALSAYVYFNFFIHSWSPKEVLDRLKVEAETAFTTALTEFKENYLAFSKVSGEPMNDIHWEPRVMTYEDMHSLLQKEYGEVYETHMNAFNEQLLQQTELDTRMFAARVVEEAWKWMPDKNPAIIMFYSSLYSPRIEVTGKNDKEQNLLDALEVAVETVQPEYPHPIVTKNFFPYISDMSFVALSDDAAGISAVSSNNPGWGTKHFVDYEAVRAINVPVINIGPYGYDAHKQYERMEKSFSLNIVPNLTNEVIQQLIGGK
ncbi:M20/M25/M40 family metallo-hydrolase [Paenisporosarcina quisquiliarum]|uniref:M20/M25/M40 family metallo-hydrolase n=1 Tax=Paenisporosarcina quisquiliarum TaxID=365346 RepID=A0A9X3LIN5_9BACL|nr:M20/M25/M40 family metallo-hydrolase [Paenisporosarcina quisquiliarum]MCZ8537711.1 M20/M25/M40 family metallo-hydrolase [Paenisporosarcina quisquiliarum]